MTPIIGATGGTLSSHSTQSLSLPLSLSLLFISSLSLSFLILSSDFFPISLWLMKAKAFVENSQINLTVVDSCKLNTFDMPQPTSSNFHALIHALFNLAKSIPVIAAKASRKKSLMMFCC